VQVDAVFWLDIALTFCTGILHEREGFVECVRVPPSSPPSNPRGVAC
jgi:hypothetical protein